MLYMLIYLGICLSIVGFFSGCREPKADTSVLMPVISESESDEVPISEYSNFTSDTTGWSVHTGSGIDFLYPADWHASVDEYGASIIVKDTDKEIVLGSAGPEDFYRETTGGFAMNSGKYADKYTAITVDVFSGYANVSWAKFFADKYPEVVREFETFPLYFRPEFEAAQATRISGIFPGDARVFVRSGDIIYDISLNFRGRDEQHSYEIFNAFLEHYNY